MKTFRSSTILILIIWLAGAAATAAQDWRGMGRLAGKVVDESGAPVDGVVVKARRGESNAGPDVKTNKKGEFILAGINGGQWALDFEKAGYVTKQMSASIQEHSTNPPMNVTLKKAAVDPNVQIRGDLEKAAALMKDQKFGEARAIYETILAQHPEAYQVEPYIARTYYGEHQLDPAIQHLRAALEKDPQNVDVKVLLASVLAEKGDADGSRQVIASIDDSKITDPTMLLNVGINLINQKKADEAMTWFDRTIARFPDYASSYYYRGITELQLAKNDQAKADLTKFVSMAPAAPEAATAKEILEKIK